jgi:hypothetical protein
LASRLSIIIPVAGHPSQMEDSLVSILENRPADCEILVVVNQAYADPYELKDEVHFVQARRGAQQIELINLGIRASSAEIVHVLGCGIVAAEGWVEPALDRFEDSQVAAVTPVIVDRDKPRRCLAAGATYGLRSGILRRRTSRPWALAASRSVLIDPIYMAAFYRRSALDDVGLFSAACGRYLAGIDLGLALLEAGRDCVLEPNCQLSAEPERFAAPRGFRQGRAAERLYWRWLPDKGRLASVGMHALAVAAEWGLHCVWPAATARLAGRAVGMAQTLTAGRSTPAPAEASKPATPPASRLPGPHFASGARRQRNQDDDAPLAQSDEWKEE